MSTARSYAGGLSSSGTSASVDTSTSAQSRPEGLKRKARSSTPTSDSAEGSRAAGESSSRVRFPVRKAARRCQERLQGESEDESDDDPHDNPTYKLSVPTALPDHSPSTPLNTIPCSNGYRFTEEDKKFFVDMVLWQTKLDNNVTTGEGRATRRADRRRDACLGDRKMRVLLRHADRATRPERLTKPANPALLLPPLNLPPRPWEPYSNGQQRTQRAGHYGGDGDHGHGNDLRDLHGGSQSAQDGRG